ncbi:MAG: beta-galactosidase small subunit [Lachnospiraceae bacterium]|nr:beta-galactosidase small subunit [Lachnospiraceae bacterium]
MADTGLRLIFGDAHLGVSGDGFEYLFSYGNGGLESLSRNGKEWLFRVPQPALWRALTDNDRGNGFHRRSGIWLSADAFPVPKGCTVWRDGEEIPLPIPPENNRYSENETASGIKLCFGFETIISPSPKIFISYTVSADGSILINARYEGAKGLPELPVFGVRFIMPTPAAACEYEGLSGETYPDRMAGGIKGTYAITDFTPEKYLKVQEYGMHMETERVKITRNRTLNNADPRPDEEFSLVFSREDEPFAFTCIPYTPEELESATHPEELPLPRRTVFTVYGAVRGVGGIDSWGADVSEPYHVSGEGEIGFSFRILPQE